MGKRGKGERRREDHRERKRGWEERGEIYGGRKNERERDIKRAMYREERKKREIHKGVRENEREASKKNEIDRCEGTKRTERKTRRGTERGGEEVKGCERERERKMGKRRREMKRGR